MFRLFYVSEFRGLYNTDEYEIWLLSPNIVKFDNGSEVWVSYNATVEVFYHHYPKKE